MRLKIRVFDSYVVTLPVQSLSNKMISAPITKLNLMPLLVNQKGIENTKFEMVAI